MTTIERRPRGFRRVWAAIVFVSVAAWIACFQAGPPVVRWVWLW